MILLSCSLYMVSSREIITGSLWGVKPRGFDSIELPPTVTLPEVGTPLNPRTISPSLFRELDGYTQETVLGFLLSANDLAGVAALRPDFDVSQPLSGEEMTISYLVGEIIRGEKPITPSSSIFAQIYALGYPIGESELVAKLEGERERARVKFPEAFFAPAEDIGSFCAARRYFASLEMVIHPKAAYSRDYFKPLEPNYFTETYFNRESIPVSEEQLERDRRTQAAHDAYGQEVELPGTF